MPTSLETVADQLLNDLKQRLGRAWDERFDAAQRQLVQDCFSDAVQLQLTALAAPQTPEAQLQLLQEKAQINGQLANIADLEAGPVSDLFWQVVQRAVSTAVTIAFAAL